MARYTKKQRELKHDVFRDRAMKIFEQLGHALEGKGVLILRIFGAVAALLIIFGLWNWRTNKKTDEARRALGRAIEISSARVASTPTPGSTDMTFPTETARSEAAIKVFQAVAAKYGDPYRENAKYFIATNKLVTNRAEAVSELEALSKSGDLAVATMSRFALAQAKESDGQYDAAVALYLELLRSGQTILPVDTVNLRIAAAYEKQGKKTEAADVLFNVVDAARKAKDPDGKPASQSSAAREAAQKLEKLDAARYQQLPPEPPPADFQM